MLQILNIWTEKSAVQIYVCAYFNVQKKLAFDGELQPSLPRNCNLLGEEIF